MCLALLLPPTQTYEAYGFDLKLCDDLSTKSCLSTNAESQSYTHTQTIKSINTLF